MGKLVFTFTNFIGINVNKIKYPNFIDYIDIKKRYSELMPELSILVNPLLYLSTCGKPEAQYLRENEGIPDLYPLEVYPKCGKDLKNIEMVGLYIDDIISNLKVGQACNIIIQSLEDCGFIVNEDDIEILISVPTFVIDSKDIIHD